MLYIVIPSFSNDRNKAQVWQLCTHTPSFSFTSCTFCNPSTSTAQHVIVLIGPEELKRIYTDQTLKHNGTESWDRKAYQWL